MPKLGPYRLTAKLGEGGMGVVYQATDEQLKREVAIKVLHPQLLRHEDLMDRFRREARMHAKLIHPNIVTLLSLYEDGEHTALVMEMVRGHNLKDYLRQNPKPKLSDVMRISEAILSGLQAAHAQGMVHRDLKPANVLLADDGSIKLMDFGLAKLEQGDDDLTRSGATVGSFRYMAPEQILNQAVDGRTDLYAVGIMMYQMCTGKLPFDSSANGGEFEIMEKQVREDPIPPREINPLLPIAMSDLILALLAKSPHDRPSDCETVRKLLAAVTRQKNTPHATPIPRISAPESSAEIAKGLLSSYSRRLIKAVWRGWMLAKPYGIDLPLHWFHRATSAMRQHFPHQLDTPFRRSLLTVGIMLFLWIMLGLIIGHDAPSVTDQKAAVEQSGVSTSPAPDTNKPEEGTGGAVATLALTTAEQEEKPATSTNASIPVGTKGKTTSSPKKSGTPARKTAPKKAQEQKMSLATASRPAPKSITFSVGSRVVRSDGSKAGKRDRHEFRGGTHVFFSDDLPAYTLINKEPVYKDGWVRLYLRRTVRLSAIVIHKISVGRKSFAGGEVEMEVRDRKGHWTDVLNRKNRDIDRPLRIDKPRRALAEVKGIRLRFKTPQPITIGPIDLLP